MRQIKLYFLFCILLVVSTLGCDQIAEIKDRFQKPKKEASSSNSSKPMSSNTLARVGSWSISSEDFKVRLEALKEVVPDYDINDLQAKRAVLDELVNQQLFVLEAEKSGLAYDKDIVAAVDEFRRTLIVREAARKITEKISVSDEEARDFYETNKEQIIEPLQLRVREMVLDSQIKASEVHLEVLRGSDFAELARQNSKSASAENGGDLGFIEEVPFPQMANELLALEQGEVSGVFKGPDGFYIVKLEEKNGGEQIPYEKVENDIRTRLILDKQQQVILDYLKELEQKFKIEINEALL